MKKITPYKTTYYKRLLELVDCDYSPCATCGSPVFKGFCCSYCGNSDPENDKNYKG
jgi:hypothetical protein